MVSKRDRFSSVARSALPLGKRKLRAKPSFTRTTSPIWPSLATRSSRITSIVVLRSDWLSAGVSTVQRRRLVPGREPAAQTERRIGEAEQRHQQHRPAEYEDRAVDAGQQQPS